MVIVSLTFKVPYNKLKEYTTQKYKTPNTHKSVRDDITSELKKHFGKCNMSLHITTRG